VTASSSTTSTIPHRRHGNKISSNQTPKKCQISQLESRAVQANQRMGGAPSLFLGEEDGGIMPRFGARIISYHIQSYIPGNKCPETGRYIFLCVGAQKQTYILLLERYIFQFPATSFLGLVGKDTFRLP